MSRGFSTSELVDRMERGWEYVFQIRRDAIFSYWRNLNTERGGNRLDRRVNNKVTERSKAYQGIDISSCSRKRLSRILDVYLMGADDTYIYNEFTRKTHKFRAAFVTLTLPPGELVDAKWAARNLINPFLQRIRRNFPGLVYVWKRELQTKNRFQIHYHLIVNKFMPYMHIQRWWNELLWRNGLLEVYWKKFGMYDEFGNIRMPNSTDVESVYDSDKLKKYVNKYFLKSIPDWKLKQLSETDRQKLKGRFWDCSAHLKLVKYAEISYSEKIDENLSNLAKKSLIKVVTDDKNLSPMWTAAYLKPGVKINEVLGPEIWSKVKEFYRAEFYQQVDFAEEFFNILQNTS